MAVSDGFQPGAKPSGNSIDVPKPVQMEQMSYAEQYDYLVAQPKGSVNFRKPCKKPSLPAQVPMLRSCQLVLVLYVSCFEFYVVQAGLWLLDLQDSLDAASV